ncbi:hypothetical protein PCANC_26646 [Puccinia coronata f. sp. avenae]|uniref:Magnesium transporter protein 1 n=1 Tax=Puccinia coronata f. sp. avenae TaxID=200324 RepID=A0A2N5RYZ1_9BASI|nr:hypothetical protein PCANC_26646 [Puccinia coronata f. sp. avenae]
MNNTLTVSLLTIIIIIILLQSTTTTAAHNDRLAKLTALTKAGKGVAPLNDKLYDEILSGPRNFSVTLLLTALGSQFQCQPCQIFDLEYQLIARQWNKQPPRIRNTHFFAMLDFKEGKNTFAKLGLNTAPQARIFLANEGEGAVTDLKKQVISYDFNKGGPRGLTAELFTDWVIEAAHLPHFFTRPPNYGRIFAASCVLLATAILGKVAWPLLRFIFTSRFIWAAAFLPIILLMVSGQMWCQIRSPPYMVKSPSGAPGYIAGGYSNQYGVETQVIASLYGVLAFAAYTLAFTVSKLDDPIRQRVAVYVWLGVFVTISSMLLNIFRMKNGSYPFKLLL